MNKKVLLPVIVVLVLLLLGGAFILRLRGSDEIEPDIENIPELPQDQKPFTSLIPTQDGHYLNLVVEDINVPGASLMEYEILYDTASGITQGIPGRVTLTGIQTIERDLLLGSESNGKFRYDEGVDDGTLTLKFRDVDGKFIGKTETTWKLYKDEAELESADGNFSYKLQDADTQAYFVVMQTFGMPANFENLKEGPYGVFASDANPHPGSTNKDFSRFSDASWGPLNNDFEDIGVFAR